MAGEVVEAAREVFLDTSLIVAATVDLHPAHQSAVMYVDRAVQLLSLVEDHQVRGKQVHDCNIVATMLVNGVHRLATRNGADFKRYGSLIALENVAD